MSKSRRGGKRIKIRVFVTQARKPHSRRAKKNCGGMFELPLIDTGYHRPKQTITLFLNGWLDKKLSSYNSISSVLNERFNINLKSVFWDNLFKPQQVKSEKIEKK